MQVKIINRTPWPLERATEGASGYDLRAYMLDEFDDEAPQFVTSVAVKLIHTGIFVEIPYGYEAQLRLRSSFGKRGFRLANGVGTVDSDYRGEIMVPLTLALKGKWARVDYGTRIAQLVFARVEHPEFLVVDALGDTVRGEGGFGSTGQ